MEILIIIQDSPYGSERPYQALRMALALLKLEEGLDLTVYLTADGVQCAKKGQVTPNGYYNIERMLKPVLKKGMVVACRMCLEARGLSGDDLLDGVRAVPLAEGATLVLEADKVLTCSIALFLALIWSSLALAGDKVIAVTHFDVHADDTSLSPLGRGISDMLIGDLAGTPGLLLVERARLADLLSELELQQSGAVDPASAQEIGRLLGAEAVVVGSLTVNDGRMHASARVLSVETGEVLFAEEARGKTERFFSVEADLARNLVRGFGRELTSAQEQALEEPETVSLVAVVSYSRALEAFDEGDLETARNEARASLEADRGYRAAKKILAESSERGSTYATAKVALGFNPVLSARWGRVVMPFDLHFGGGYWLTRNLGAGGLLGVMWKSSRTAALPSPALGDFMERFTMVPARGVARIQLVERRNLAFNVWMTGGVALGRHDLVALGRLVDRHVVFAPVVGGGVELYQLRFETGIIFSAGWLTMPTRVPEDTGSLSDGWINLGGLEISVGYVFFGGSPR